MEIRAIVTQMSFRFNRMVALYSNSVLISSQMIDTFVDTRSDLPFYDSTECDVILTAPNL